MPGPGVYVELRATISDFEAKMAAARAEMSATQKHGEGAFSSLMSGGTKALEGIGAAAIGVGVVAVKMASDFQASMERLHTQAGVPQAAIADLSKGVLNLAGQVGFSPTSLSEALFHVESSFASTGISGKDAMQILKTAAEGAAIGGADLVSVTNALDAAIASGIPGVQNFGQAMGSLNAIVGAGDMTMQNLAEALGSGVLAVVKNYGLSLSDVGAALATFGDNNIRGAQAATYLRMAVQAIAVPAKAGAQALADVGMTTNQMARDMQSGGLISALEDLKKHFEAAGITGTRVGEELTTIFGKRAGSGVAVLYDQLSRLQSKYEDIRKGASQFDADWAATQQTFAQRWKDAVAGVDAFLVALGSRLLPVASNVLGWLRDAGGWLGRHQVLLTDVAKVITSVLVPALILWGARQAVVISEQVMTTLGSMVSMVGNLAREMTAMGVASDIATGPLGMITAALTALIMSFGDTTKIGKDAQGWIESFTAALSPTTNHVTALKAEFDKLTAAMDDNLKAGGKGKIMVDNQALSQHEWEQRMEATGKALTDAENAQKALTQGQAEAKKVQDGLNLTVAQAPSLLGGLTQAEKDAADAAKSDKIAVTELKGALDALIGIHLSAEKATIAYNQSVDAITAGIVKDSQAVNDNTKLGQDNINVVITAIEKAIALADATAKETGDVGGANKALYDHVQQLLEVARKAGLTKDQVDQLTARFDLQALRIGITSEAVQALRTQYGKVPTRIATDIVATLNLDPSAAAAAVAGLAARVAAFQNQLRVVSQGLTPTGGAFQAGGITSGPVFLAGEGDPAHPEYVIPTDPMYRSGAVDLWKKLGKDLHMYAAGGIVGDQAGAAGSAVGVEMVIRRALMQQSLIDATSIANNIGSAVQQRFSAALVGGAGPGGPSGPVSGDVGSWLAAAIAFTGVPAIWMQALARMVQLESGGNPLAANRTAAGLAAGLPEGLLQTIPSTFAAYMMPGHGNIWNPVDNAIAAIRYIQSRYGSPFNIRGVFGGNYVGYDVPFGTAGILKPGLTMAVNTTGQNEYISRTPPGGGGGSGPVTIVLQLNGHELAKAIFPDLQTVGLRRGRQTVNLGLS